MSEELTAQRQSRPGEQQGGRPSLGPLSAAMRQVLNLASAARVGVSRRMRMSLNDLLAIEHVMTTHVGPGGEPVAVGPSELARTLGVTTAATTQSLHRLEASGHVRRRPHPHDARRQVVEVTPEGARDVFTTLAPLFQMLEAQAALLSPAEQKAVLKFLDGQQVAYRQFLAHLGATPPREEGHGPARPSRDQKG